jgi:hypothetical protein
MPAADKDELSKATVAKGVLETAALFAPPPYSAALSAAAMATGLVSRIAVKRSAWWWDGFLNECARRKGVTPAQMRQMLEEQMRADDTLGAVIFAHAKQALDVTFEGCLPILGALSAAYQASGLEADAFYRAGVALLTQCSGPEFAQVRTLIGRLACVVPTTKSGTLSLETMFFGSKASWERRVAQLELETGGSMITTTMLGADWLVGSDWRQTDHLLTSTGLARGDGLSKLIVRHAEMARMQTFLKQGSEAAGSYRFTMRGSSGSFTAELELFPECFGYGTTPEDATELLRRNLKMFVQDAERAALVKI